MADTTTSGRTPLAADPVRKPAHPGVKLRTLHHWHWVSSAICLLGMLLFSVTGITLNHAAQIEAKPRVTLREATLPAGLLADLKKLSASRTEGSAPLPPPVQQWARETWSANLGEIPAEWSAQEVYLPLPRPGGDAWLRIDLADGAVEYEVTDRGWISYLNDLHKGRHTGTAWNWFIDLFGVACLIFSLTGFLILKFHAHRRPSTWPMVGLGLVVPALIALLFIH
jgi:hypothetical protein